MQKTTTPLTSKPTSTPIPQLKAIEPENANRVAQLAVLDAGGTAVKAVGWSPGGNVLAAGAYREVQLWDARTGKRLATLQGHTDQVYGVAWSPNGQMLASACTDGTTRIWDSQKLTTLYVLQAHSSVALNYVLSVAWSPDGGRLVTSNIDGTLEMWDARGGKHLAAWKGHHPEDSGKTGPWALAAFAAVWSPDGQRIASTREDNIVQLWDDRIGKVLNVLQTNVGSANIVAWSPDGQTLAVSNDLGTVQLWNARTGKNLTELKAHEDSGWANAVTWSPNGRMLALSRQYRIVQLWDVKTGKELAVLDRHTQEVWGAAWSPDGLRIASGSDDATIRLWGVQ